MSIIHRDDTGSKLGMWLFLFTEMLLFGGLFLVYAAYRYAHPDDFKAAALEMDLTIGTINTIILLTSSLTVVLGITALRNSRKNLTVIFLLITIVLGLVFLVNKSFEWGAKFQHGIYPKGPEMVTLPNGQVLYFGLYFTMTGLHALHVFVGMVFLAVVLNLIIREKINMDNHQKFENAGLFWHLVDIIWIFLFPLFYLIH